MSSMTESEMLAKDIARLAARPYSEVGVPMFVIAQDRTAKKDTQPPVSVDFGLAERFAALAAASAEQNPALTLVDIARLVEVLADRHLLALNGPHFTEISDTLGSN